MFVKYQCGCFAIRLPDCTQIILKDCNEPSRQHIFRREEITSRYKQMSFTLLEEDEVRRLCLHIDQLLHHAETAGNYYKPQGNER